MRSLPLWFGQWLNCLAQVQLLQKIKGDGVIVPRSSSISYIKGSRNLMTTLYIPTMRRVRLFSICRSHRVAITLKRIFGSLMCSMEILAHSLICSFTCPPFVSLRTAPYRMKHLAVRIWCSQCSSAADMKPQPLVMGSPKSVRSSPV